MSYVKAFSLLTVAAAVTLSFAAAATATSVTTTTGGPTETHTLHLVNENGHATFKNPFFTVSCGVTAEGIVEAHGTGLSASGNIAALLFPGCTNGWHVTTYINGTFAIDWENGHNGIIRSTGAEIDLTRFGLTCILETNNTVIGTVTGGNPATLSIAAALPINTTKSSPACGAGTAAWSGSLVTTSALYVEA